MLEAQCAEPMSLTYHLVLRKLYTEPTRFQWRILKCEKLTDDGRQVMIKAHVAFCLWQGELYKSKGIEKVGSFISTKCNFS